MARLYKHGTVERRYVKADAMDYLVMSDGKILKGGSGRYKLVKLKPSKTISDLERSLAAAGWKVKL